MDSRLQIAGMTKWAHSRAPLQKFVSFVAKMAFGRGKWSNDQMGKRKLGKNLCNP